MAFVADCGLSMLLEARCVTRTVGFLVPGQIWRSRMGGKSRIRNLKFCGVGVPPCTLYPAGRRVCYDESMRVSRFGVLVSLVLLATACGERTSNFLEVAPAPRRLVVWLENGEIDVETSAILQAAGVDEIVLRRGRLDLAGRAPVLRLDPAGEVAGSIPVGIALEVGEIRPGLDRAAAEAVWRAIEAEFGASVPAELILDLPQLAEGLDNFIIHLSQSSGLAVVPLLGFEQLQTELGLEVAKAARTCIVPAFGTDDADLRGIGELDPLPLEKKLGPLAGSGVRVRAAIVLRSRTEPPLVESGDDLDPLTERQTTTMTTETNLDRKFVFEKPVVWSGRSWSAGDAVAVRWMDAARLHAALAEIHRIALPDIAGWDLVPLPAEETQLGLSREALLRYLGGEGPEPDIQVQADRSGRSLRIKVSNPSPFATTVSNHGNWVQVSVAEGWLVAEGRGSFDRSALGTVQRGQWASGDLERVNAVRFYEVYVAPGEEIVSGTVRVPSSRSQVTVSWRFTLSDGSEIIGETER